MSKPTQRQIDEATKILLESGINITGLTKKLKTQAKKQSKIETPQIKQRKKTKNKKLSAKMEKMIDETIADQIKNPHQYSFTDLCKSVGETRKLTLKQYNNMKQTILDYPKYHKAMAKEIERELGTDKILKIQQLIYVYFGEMIHISHCMTLLSSPLFKIKASEYSTDYFYQKIAC